mmetsp:Transcript_42414/g.72414  ORF Transcript_42414/g.72414 Transcript_42414/m.72414 type:complete len:600 (+) Transcript_42414:260-2059(+)|eukprot:CAMPEP_0183730806 /NCGR_PEP_ID=MMETSP0737-20130205/33716_1 /TAXON_ID=385413 /ORGANISM="Thalassiosira miniscula, Strain CCMP1093" /LENGTH=599 /DNA_ID=CAMNT_0025963387 /DNA_START=104 /DNA_END=1903 /DNA_ORIENTATION=-
MHSTTFNFFVIFIATIGALLLPPTVAAKPSILSPSLLNIKKSKSSSSSKASKNRDDDAYLLLARSIQKRLNIPPPDSSESTPTKYDIATISSALRSLSTTQAALKKIDGTAHEMYQRTHKSSTSLDDETDDENEGAGEGGSGSGKIGGLKVAGRMSRNAARVGCIADALFAAEMCELILLLPPDMAAEDKGKEESSILNDEEGTLASWTGRQLVLNTTIRGADDLSISVLVIYEPDYNGGAGIGHGGVDDLLSFAKEEIADDDDEDNSTNIEASARGRYLVILSDCCGGKSSPSDLQSIISILDTPPLHLRLPSSSPDDGGASVCEPLYQMACKMLKIIGPVLMGDHDKDSKRTSDEESSSDNENASQIAESDDKVNSQSLPAIHFVGYSLAGGIAAIAANVLDGSLPQQKNSDKKQQQQKHAPSFSASAHGRTSALCIGPPPCLSSNLSSAFVKSIIHGDDIVPRTTHGTIAHLCDRTRRSIKGGLLGRSVGWMSEAVSLTVSGIKSSNDKGGKKKQLVVPGKVFLVRPRRIGGGSSSIHEVGSHGGREALRAALLWQLNDILLSKSLWSHHRLDAYIRSLDKVRLKGFSDAPSDGNT